MAWTFNTAMKSLSDTPTYEKAENLWEAEDLGGLTEDNNPIPMPVIWLVALTVCTAFFVTFPLWGQRPTAALYAPYIEDMDKPEILAAKDDVEAMQKLVAMNMHMGHNDAQLVRHPLTMDDLRLIAPEIKALVARGDVDLRDYTVVGDRVVIANFEGNYRPDGTRIRQQPWWDKGYTIDLFYLSAFFVGVFLVVKRLPPTSWQPRHGGGH
jgi:hypothetical protein